VTRPARFTASLLAVAFAAVNHAAAAPSALAIAPVGGNDARAAAVPVALAGDNPAGGAAPPSASVPARPVLGHDDTNYTFAIGGFAPEYEVPAPGSYELPPIDTISDHPLIDAEGRATTLAEILRGRLAVVSFIYATCGEATGCPMSTAILRSLDRRLSSSADVSDEIALVTISFDPERDTPERLLEMQKLRSPGSSWQFVTTSQATLAPLLDDFGQQIARLRYADGTWTGVFRHVLKVYLLDRTRRVRNVYSVGFLNPELVLADLETLKLEAKNE
jgi:cytochrome c peroxidase